MLVIGLLMLLAIQAIREAGRQSVTPTGYVEWAGAQATEPAAPPAAETPVLDSSAALEMAPETEGEPQVFDPWWESVGNQQFDKARAADLDKDGDTDLVVGGTLEALFVYLNDGSGEFTLESTVEGVSLDAPFAVADLDGDGFPDIVAGAEAAGARALVFFENDGKGKLTKK